MPGYTLPKVSEPEPVPGNEVVLVASGDLRQSANEACWPAQERMERALESAFGRFGVTVRRAHPFVPDDGHGFISSQRMGMEIFRSIHPEARVVVAEAVWQYSHHVLAGLRSHRGPVLTVANWEGEFPGLVGLLNLNASLTKAGRPYSTLWSRTFDDEQFLTGLETWLTKGQVDHDLSHVRDLGDQQVGRDEQELALAIAAHVRDRKLILGVFDEGCMGMYNAIFDDEMLNPLGIYKERLSQSALLAEMRDVTDAEVDELRAWLDERGMSFEFGQDEATELTEAQVVSQLRMYLAAARMGDRFGCDAIGIQYQQGLKDMVPASDLAEGLLNDALRPPTRRHDGSAIRPGEPFPHFNEVDEGAAVDLVLTNLVWSAMGLDPTSTLHDVRWGETYTDDDLDAFVWCLEISGAVPPTHLADGYAGAVSKRQPPMYFPLGGGTITGVSRPGEIVWSRVYVRDGALHLDIGRGTSVALPEQESERRWALTTPQWPMMHAVFHGVGRDQLMAQHRANHVNVIYAPDPETADRALAAKAALCRELGIAVHLCGDVTVPTE